MLIKWLFQLLHFCYLQRRWNWTFRRNGDNHRWSCASRRHFYSHNDIGQVRSSIVAACVWYADGTLHSGLSRLLWNQRSWSERWIRLGFIGVALCLHHCILAGLWTRSMAHDGRNLLFRRQRTCQCTKWNSQLGLSLRGHSFLSIITSHTRSIQLLSHLHHAQSHRHRFRLLYRSWNQRQISQGNSRYAERFKAAKWQAVKWILSEQIF